ncbi:MAG: DUF342 domain-containing protein [Desulfobacteraceae bacterium]|nr:DUF342 domain-containing protein [Desulfobacteraceae bacterium]
MSAKGFEVSCFNTAAAGLIALKDAGTSPYALIISNYAMPEMKGDQILSKARKISPSTLRILMMDAQYREIMISAVNTARMHYCLTLPFDDEDLINQVENCCQQYTNAVKLKNLQRITRRQNKQLFQIANNLKKQEASDLSQMEEKKKQIRILESRLTAEKGTTNPDKIPSLKEILETKKIEFSPQGFGGEFIKMKNQVKQILETTAFHHSIELKTRYYKDILYQSGKERQFANLIATMTPAVRMLFHQSNTAGMDLFGKDFKQYLDKHLLLTFSPDRDKAFIQIKKKDSKVLDLTVIKYYLFWHNISHGIKSDPIIKDWLLSITKDDKPFIIAHGLSPVHSKNAVIKYYFSTDFRHSGKINEDGSINFRDRGEIPFVNQNTFLSAKLSPKMGKPGIDVLGQKIEVTEPIDETFEAGSGTRLSEDGNKIYAQIDGQPHLDAMGKVTICPELKIQGDLGFETGDITFDGNVVVEGTVKEGFKVKGASLTATAIEGAEIDLTGDLNVSLGIVDTQLVNVKGSVQAKYIHNSKINAFGDLIVQKEIMDSVIHLSGTCINTEGVITASTISANMGIDAGNIGTTHSSSTKLVVGVDEHTNKLVAVVDEKMGIHFEATTLLKEEIAALEKEDITLHKEISQYAYIQDRSQLELKNIENKIGDLKASGNMAAYQKVKNAAAQLKIDATKAEEKINQQFERQDTIVLEISQKQDRIKQLEELNLKLADEKKRLLEFTAKKQPLAQVKVGKKIQAGTQVSGPNASITLYDPDARCRIMEIKETSDETYGFDSYIMKIGAY